MREFVVEGVYAQPFDVVFNKAQEVLEELGAKIEKADADKGLIKAFKISQLFKRNAFTVTFVKGEKGVKVTAKPVTSMFTTGEYDLKTNEKFVRRFQGILKRKLIVYGKVESG